MKFMRTNRKEAVGDPDLGRNAATPRALNCNQPLGEMTPLVLDLDGTLIATDLLLETALAFARTRPLEVFRLFAWALRGRAYLKRRLSQSVEIDVGNLPIRGEVLAYAEGQAHLGRDVFIATAADQALAERLRSRFPFVKGVLGSDGVVNLKAAQKAKVLAETFPAGFTYVGDARADLAVWDVASGAVFAGRSRRLHQQLEARRGETLAIPTARPSLRDWAKALRLHQWVKNSLIFVPILLGGAAGSGPAWLSCGLGFLGLGLMASATYMINDMVDLEDDRAHWTKRERAFASGKIPLTAGIIFPPIGIVGGLALGWWAHGLPAVLAMLAYLTITMGYSLALKRVPILDVLILAGLFTLRIALGVICANVGWSPWLLVFSMFLFGSLSFTKRLTELARLKSRGGDLLPGRGYVAADEPFVRSLGVSMAASAVLVAVMYLIEEAFPHGFYHAPLFLWAFPMVLALWLGRIWLLCGRGELDDDPVVFAVNDRVSLSLGALLAIAIVCALML